MVDAQLIKEFNLEDVYFQNYKYFCHLELEIALAFPALNDKNTNENTQQDKG